MILREIGAMKASQAFNPERNSDLGRTRMGMSWLLRQMLDEAKAYDDAWDAYESGKTKEKPEFKPEWEDCRKVFSREIPVIVHTCGVWGVIQSARMFGTEYNLNTIATHTPFGGHLSAEDVAKYENVSINIGPRLLDFGRSGGTIQTARGNRFFGMGSQYEKGGVKNLSINTDSVRWSHRMPPLQELSYQASVSARLGLDELTAIKAITINPAKALMVDDRVGSLEVGKDADIVIKKGSLLDVSSPVDLVLINGKVAWQRDGVNLIADSESRHGNKERLL
jgi:imidazolonepropionase-like amidohydrolase